METVDENDEGWWQCHACLRDFDEPDERGWLRRTVCPYCESVDIEWIETRDEENGDKLGASEPGPAGPWCCPYCQERFADGQIDATRPWCPSCRTFGVIREPESGPRTQWLPLPPMLPSGPRTR